MINFNEEMIHDMLIGCCLGDNYLEYNIKKDRVNRLVIKHKNENSDYLRLKKKILDDYFYIEDIKDRSFSKYKLNEFVIKGNIEHNQNQLIYFAKILKDSSGKRILPKDLSLISPLSLYFWYLDDGCLSVQKVKRKYSFFLRKQISIALKSYSDESILKLIDYLNSTYNLNFKKKMCKEKIGWISLDNKKDIIDFINLLEPYASKLTPKSMIYKFCLCEIPQTRGECYPEYNKCNCYNTKICTCRNKNYNDN